MDKVIGIFMYEKMNVYLIKLSKGGYRIDCWDSDDEETSWKTIEFDNKEEAYIKFRKIVSRLIEGD